MTVLVTGGAGYLGSHIVLDLVRAGTPVAVVDDLSTGDAEALARVERLTGRRIPRHLVDLRDRSALRRVFALHDIRAVVHTAGPSGAAESVREPLECYENTLEAMLVLLRTMQAHQVRRLVHRSVLTADPSPDPSARPSQDVGSPAVRARRMTEQLLADLTAGPEPWHVIVLRTATVVGADPSGTIGESTPDPTGLLPSICRVAAGWAPHLAIQGTDHRTLDGTAVRDYVHVADVAAAHRAALDRIDDSTALRVLDIATGSGRTVHEVIDTFERTTGVRVPTVAAPARPGEPDTLVGDPRAAAALLGWTAARTLDSACRDAWRWQVGNPVGYAGVLRRRPHRMQPAVHHGTLAGARTARRMSRWVHQH